jgi:hypothetical protein
LPTCSISIHDVSMAADQAVANAALLREMSAEIAAVAIKTFRGRANDASHRAPAGEAAIATERDRVGGLEQWGAARLPQDRGGYRRHHDHVRENNEEGVLMVQ